MPVDKALQLIDLLDEHQIHGLMYVDDAMLYERNRSRRAYLPVGADLAAGTTSDLYTGLFVGAGGARRECRVEVCAYQ